MRKFLKKNKFQIFKFVIVGIGSTLLNFIVYTLIFQFSSRIILASFIGYFCGLLNSFYFSNNWVFIRSKNKKTSYAFFLFIVIYFLGGLEMALIINYVDKLIHNYKFAWLCGAFVAAINNYLFSKYLLFDE